METFKSIYKKMNVLLYQMKSPYRNTIYLPGWNISDSKQKLKKINGFIYRGIHVYLNKPTITRFTVVKFKANIEDLICIGYNRQAVFRKVYLSKSEYYKHIKG